MAGIFDSFASYLKNEKRSSVLTVKAYLDDLLQFRDFTQTTYMTENLAELNHLQVRSWIVFLMDQGINARSVNRKLSALRTYYRFLKREGRLLHDPMKKVQGPKAAKRLPEFVAEEQMDKLLSSLRFTNDFKGWRDRAVLEFFYATGVRRAELIDLKLKDIDLRRRVAKVMGKRSKERLVPLHESLVKTLQSYLEHRAEKITNLSPASVFISEKGNKLNPRAIYSIVNQYLAESTTLSKKSPHVLRHTFATHLLNRGADLNAIKELLGHANLTSTQIYTHNSISELKEIYRKSHPRS
ncbi:MAG: tyrosine-type recombinase/integrase [Bacteroidia bacterium]|nr:tyrosine-type recombinase/integrase [Bacteroidia bacterium]